MPKITLVREDRIAPFWRVAIVGDAATVVTEAINETHPGGDSLGECHSNTCDIHAALAAGYPFAAAWLLSGATEVYPLDAAVRALEFNGVEVPSFMAEFDEWCASDASDSVECPECSSRVYRDFGDGCGSCLADLTIDVDAMAEEYMATALWSSLDDDGKPLDDEYGTDDIDESSRDEMRADCQSFAESNIADLMGMDPVQAGHDFWLTRNGHGAGFWDRGLGDRGDRLTAASEPFGDSDLYVGDDGAVHVS